mmetsp:Transcript_22028/g.16417  ORF Transcript_22028/g.16417 Transcript_22028/m.16417 type:complete len:93 (-) Transcript_22028:274-552(-)
MLVVLSCEFGPGWDSVFFSSVWLSYAALVAGLVLDGQFTQTVLGKYQAPDSEVVSLARVRLPVPPVKFAKQGDSFGSRGPFSVLKISIFIDV